MSILLAFVMVAKLIEGNDKRLGIGTVIIPVGLDARRKNS
jgi:hypothetical protein